MLGPIRISCEQTRYTLRFRAHFSHSEKLNIPKLKTAITSVNMQDLDELNSRRHAIEKNLHICRDLSDQEFRRIIATGINISYNYSTGIKSVPSLVVEKTISSAVFDMNIYCSIGPIVSQDKMAGDEASLLRASNQFIDHSF